ncbi:hypothetical protein MMEU_1356 [Mycobacterium marinum str. Europe]|nr:hypothetical protein MMEU_1356 [Mycobacterium marinum str. Europe]
MGRSGIENRFSRSVWFSISAAAIDTMEASTGHHDPESSLLGA